MRFRHRWIALSVAGMIFLFCNVITPAAECNESDAVMSGESTAEKASSEADGEAGWDETTWDQWDAAKTRDKAQGHSQGVTDPQEEELYQIRKEQEVLLEELPPEEETAKAQAAKPDSVKPEEPSAAGTPVQPEKPAENEASPTVREIAALQGKKSFFGRYLLAALLLAAAAYIGIYSLRHPEEDDADNDTEPQG